MRHDSIQRSTKILLLLGMGGFLLSQILNNTLYYYISERFSWLTSVAVIGFAIVGVGYWWMRNSDAAACGCADPHHEHGHHEHGHHEHGHNLDWRGVALVALPLVLGFLVPPQPLGAAALQNRNLSVGSIDSVMPAAVRQAQEKSTSERTVLDWVLAFRAAPASGESFDGVDADVIGFVYRDETTNGDSFWLTRFVVGCCVADASPVALQVEWASGDPLETDTWVRVRGPLREQDGGQAPVLQAQYVEPVTPPASPTSTPSCP